MDKFQLEQKWNSLIPDGSGYKSLRISGDCIPDLFIAIYNANIRCLILKLPDGKKANFQSTEKANLSIEYYRETKWIILKLLDNNFTDLFDDLILSIYGRICNMDNASAYSSELISMFYKWSEFFNDKTAFRLSEETIRGIFGELLVLKDYVEQADALALNDLLGTWKGPFNNRHDFVMLKKNLEVKTMEDTALDILISSEFQLVPDTGKDLELVVVRILRDRAGISLRDLVLDIRQMVISRLADFTIILKALNHYGLNLRVLREYDDYRYRPVAIDTYNCLVEGFPKITPGQIAPSINKVSYQLRITALNNFLLSSKNI